MRVLLTSAAALLFSACTAARPTVGASLPSLPDGDARAVLGAFASALDQGRWEAAYPLLSARWRAQETPSRLASDLAASGTIGRDAVQRVRALVAAGAPLSVSGDTATLDVGDDKEARLVREGGVWRVDALE